MKDDFERQAREYVGALPWVKQVRKRLPPPPFSNPALGCCLFIHPSPFPNYDLPA